MDFLCYHHADRLSYEKACAKLRKEIVDAVLIAPNFREETISLTSYLEGKKIPYAFVDFNIEDTHALCYIGQDSQTSGYMAAKILMRKYKEGHWVVEGDRGGAIMQRMEDPSVTVRTIAKEHRSEHDGPAYNDNDWYIRKQNIRTIDEFAETAVTDKGLDTDWGSIYKNIKNVLDGKEELLVKPREVLRSMRVIDAAFESSKYNKVVALDC